MITKGPTMCILPWMHIYTSAGGDVVPCCEAQESIMNAGNLRETWNGKFVIVCKHRANGLPNFASDGHIVRGPWTP